MSPLEKRIYQLLQMNLPEDLLFLVMEADTLLLQGKEKEAQLKTERAELLVERIRV